MATLKVQTLMESLVAQQVQEMELVRQKVYNLEQNQNAIKQRYILHPLNLCCDDIDGCSKIRRGYCTPTARA